MELLKKIRQEVSLLIAAFIAGAFSSYGAATIIEGLGFVPGSFLFVVIVILLTLIFFISLFTVFAIILGMFPVFSYIHYSVYEYFVGKSNLPEPDREKMEQLKRSIKVK